MDINLHIERLVLDGVDIAAGQGDLLQASDEKSQVLGQQIAKSVYGGIGRE